MALQVEWEADSGIVCDEAYAIVKNLQVTKEESKEFLVRFKVKIWASKIAYDNDKANIDAINGRINVNKNNGKTQYNIIKQCYEELKTLEGWTDAIDC